MKNFIWLIRIEDRMMKLPSQGFVVVAKSLTRASKLISQFQSDDSATTFQCVGVANKITAEKSDRIILAGN